MMCVLFFCCQSVNDLTVSKILSDEKKREAYDKFGEASQQPGFDPDAFANARGPFGGGGFSGFEDLASLFGAKKGRGSGNVGHDVFETLFGASPRGRARGGRGAGDFRGDDLEATVTLSFLDAAKGMKSTARVAVEQGHEHLLLILDSKWPPHATLAVGPGLQFREGATAGSLDDPFFPGCVDMIGRCRCGRWYDHPCAWRRRRASGG